MSRERMLSICGRGGRPGSSRFRAPRDLAEEPHQKICTHSLDPKGSCGPQDYLLAGARRFNSSNQFNTMLICVAACSCSLALTMRNR